MEEAPAARDDIESFLRERRNWGRWGDDDQIGAVNLITAAKRLEAAALVYIHRSSHQGFDVLPTVGNYDPWGAAHRHCRTCPQPAL